MLTFDVIKLDAINVLFCTSRVCAYVSVVLYARCGNCHEVKNADIDDRINRSQLHCSL